MHVELSELLGAVGAVGKSLESHLACKEPKAVS